MMEIKTTTQIYNDCIEGINTYSKGNEDVEKKWIAVDDVLKWVLEMELGGSISIAETKELKAQKRGEMLMLNKFRLKFGKTKR